ncbi:MAG: VanZ family protein [Sphaerochaetaceae bacterium]
MLFLIWVILFKLQFSLMAIDRARALNLVPFHYEDSDNPGFHFKEVMDNVLIFIPLGIYLSMLWRNMKLMTKAGIIIAVSLSFEILQYILRIGVSDITDLLTNTAGGLIGMRKSLKNHRTNIPLKSTRSGALAWRELWCSGTLKPRSPGAREP